MENEICGKSKELGNEFWSLFLRAKSSRVICGGNNQLRRSDVFSKESNEELPELEVKLPEGFATPDRECDCIAIANESCSICETPTDDVCKADFYDNYKKNGLFDGLSDLLTNVKLHEFSSSVSASYAATGNRPHQLKARKIPQLNGEHAKEAAKVFYEYIDDFLSENKVTIDESPDIFNTGKLRTLQDSFVQIIKEQSEKASRKSIKEYEDIISDIFHRTQFMQEYIKTINDTKWFPHGILWLSSNQWLKHRTIKNGKLSVEWDIQSSAERIDPRFFWATEDWTLNKEGTACFKLERVSRGDIKRVIKGSKNPCLNKNIEKYLGRNESGSRIHSASLFLDESYCDIPDRYEIMIGRGKFSRKALEEAGVPIEESYRDEDYIKADITYGDGMILRVNVIPNAISSMGVFFSVFRERNDRSIYGIPLNEFIRPFANFYESLFERLDESTEKTLGSIVSMDTAVIEDPERYMSFNESTGAFEIDLSGTTVLPFDSSSAIGSPNFKGVPIHVAQLPSDLPTLLPLISIARQELEMLTGIPSIISTGTPGSSAIRTEKLYNAAYNAASKPIKEILRNTERRMLEPAIQYFLDVKLSNGDIPKDIAALDPEILLSDELIREFNDDERMWNNIQKLFSTAGMVQADKLSEMINQWGHEVGYEAQLIPSSIASTGQNQQSTPPEAV